MSSPSAKLTSLTERLVVVFAGVFLFARCFIGADLRDGAYALVLTRRIAAGARPLVDEMSLHVLGALPAVPFVALWRTLAGDFGLVLAYRMFSAAFIALLLVISARALRGLVSSLAATIAVASVSLAPPYSLVVTNYNSVGMTCLVLAVCATFRALARSDRRWAAVASSAATFATFAFPSLVLGTAPLLIVLAVGMWKRTRSLSATALCVGLPSAALVGLLGPYVIAAGVASAWQTVVFNATMRPGTGSVASLTSLFRWYGDFFFSIGKVQLALAFCALAAALTKPVPRLVALLPVPLLLAWYSAKSPSPNTLNIDAGTYPAAMAVLLTVSLAPMAIRAAVGDKQYRLFLLIASIAIPAAIGVQATSASGFDFGVAFVGLAPLFLAVCVGFAEAVGDGGDATCRLSALGQRIVALTPLPCLLLCSLMVVFNEGPMLQHRALIRHGPAAGLFAADISRMAHAKAENLAAECPVGSRALAITLPGVYLFLPPHSAAPASWIAVDTLPAFLPELERRRPDCVIAPPGDSFTIRSDYDERERARMQAGLEAQKRLLRRYQPAGPERLVDEAPVQGKHILRTYVRRSDDDTHAVI